MLPKEPVEKHPEYLNIPRNIRDITDNEEYISSDNIYQFLQFYGTIYNSFKDAEKKELMKTFIKKVEICKEPLSNGDS